MEPYSEDKKENIITENYFNTFFNDKEINLEGNKEKLFESFLLFQQFMSYMIRKPSNEHKEFNQSEPGFTLNNISIKKNTNSFQFENDVKLTDDPKFNREGKQLKEEIHSSLVSNDKQKCHNFAKIVEDKTYFNYDDIPVKCSTVNFVELVEKNLSELQYQPEIKNENVERKVRLNLQTNKTIHIKRDNRLSHSTNNRKKNKESNCQADNYQKTKSLPKKAKREPLRNTNLNMKIKEEIKDEEKPKDLPNFIKKDYDNPIEVHNRSIIVPDEIIQKANRKDSFHPDVSINNLLNRRNHSNKKENKFNINNNNNNNTDSDNDEIINNSDSFFEEENKKNTKEQNRILLQIKNKELLEEINKIKGDATLIINNPLYSSDNNIIHKRKNSLMIHDSNIKEDIIQNKNGAEYENELLKLNEDNIKVEKLKKEYNEMKQFLQKEIEAFNQRKKREYLEIDRIKNEELIKSNKLKISKSFNNQSLIKHQQENQLLVIKKDKEEIENLKLQISKLQEDHKLKDNIHRNEIDKTKKQLQDANSQINILLKANKASYSCQISNNSNIVTYHNDIINTIPNTNIKEKILYKKNSSKSNISARQNKNIISNRSTNYNNIRLIKDDCLVETFELSFPSKYNQAANVSIVKEEQLNEGTKMFTYSNKMKEIIFSSGVKKKVYEDGYQIIFFKNNDIKQIYPDGKIVYYFSEENITQTTFPNNLQVYLFPNGQIEKHHPNGKKEVISTLKASTSKIQEQKKKKTTDDVLLSNKSNGNKSSSQLIKLKTFKNKDEKELYEFY